MLIAVLKSVIAFVVVQALLVIGGVAAGADLGIAELWIVTAVAVVVAVVVFRRSRPRPSVASSGARV